MFGISYDNTGETRCVDICPSDVYDIESQVCSINTSVEGNELKGVSATIGIAPQTETINVIFNRAVSFNENYILSATHT